MLTPQTTQLVGVTIPSTSQPTVKVIASAPLIGYTYMLINITVLSNIGLSTNILQVARYTVTQPIVRLTMVVTRAGQ
jgi:hypothetical protein